MRLPIRQITPDVLEVRRGGGCLSIFGLPFLAAGIFMLLASARVVPLDNASEVPAWSWPLLALMGLVFAAVGGGLAFGRCWIVLDGVGGRVVERWGLLVPLRSKARPLADFDAVLLCHQTGDSDSAESFPVALRALSGGPDQNLCSLPAYPEARALAARVARAIRLPLVERTTDHEAVLPAERADTSLQERLRGERGASRPPERPPRMRSQVRDTGAGIRIVIPGPGFKLTSLVGFLVPAGIVVAVAPGLVEFFERTHTPRPVQLAFLGFLVFAFGLLPALGLVAAVLAGARSRTAIAVSAGGLLIEERGALRTRATRIPAVDILDLDFGTAGSAQTAARKAAQDKLAELHSGASAMQARALRWAIGLARLARAKGITLKTRTGLVTFAARLPDDEIVYLHALILRILLGEPVRLW
jgi:hypothetical protein